MKRLLCLAVGLALVCSVGAGDAPKQDAPRAADGAHDVVYFAESRPVLLRLHVTVDGRPLSALWDECVTKVFRYLDANGDGALDRNEVQRVPPPDALFGGQFGVAPPSLDQLDTNHDGNVSRDELAAWYRRAGAGPVQVATGGAPRDLQEQLLIQGLDDLEAQVILVDGGLGGRRRPGNPDALNDALFQLLDTNGDGKLSKDELLAAPAVLLKRDRNDDEMITPDEILPGTGGREAALGFTVIRRQIREIPAAAGPFWLARQGESTLDLAGRLLRQYAKGDNRGGPPKQKLNRTEVGLDEATFAKLDVDGDGFLDTEELARFAQRPPDLELKIDLGAKASVELVKQGAPLEANVRAGRDGVLMLEMAGTRLDLKSLAKPNVDRSVNAKRLREQYLAEFKKADRDNNGYLDMAEAMRSPLYRNLFKAMDRDGDGMLFEKEVLAYLDANQELQAAARSACASVAVTAEGKGLFELLDVDGDGRLSVRELRNAVKLIAELDRDGDGCVCRTEIPRCSLATFGTGPAQAAARYAASGVAFTPDGQLVRGRGQPQRPARGPEWFRKMDRNGDGDVSRREFLGTDEQFREIDTNGDGLISVEEAEAYDKKMREKK